MYLACLRLPPHIEEETLERLGPALDGLNIGYYVGREGAEDDDSADWIMRWIVEDKPDLNDFSMRVQIWAESQNLPVSHVANDWFSEDIPDDIDWLAESYKGFEPFTIGPFFVFGSHYEGEKPDNQIPLQIDAATAFGSGEHATTAGCLRVMAELKEKSQTFSNVLDMGCGSGILAIAAWKLWQCPVLAVDIEDEARIVSERHKSFNNVPNDMRCFAGDGFDTPAVKDTAPFDLIVANILAGPLKDMASDLTAHIVPQGTVILSGILNEQAEDVMAAYKAAGLQLQQHEKIREWSTLRLIKP